MNSDSQVAQSPLIYLNNAVFEREHFISIKGFVGDSNVEVRYKKEYQDLVADYFHLLYYYDQDERGISTLKG